MLPATELNKGIREALQLHERVAETAVIGVMDKIKGQVPLAFMWKEIADLSEDDDNTGEELDALITEELAVSKPKQIFRP